MEASSTKIISPNAEEYKNIEYWKPHFHPNSQISMNYYTVDDGTKLLGTLVLPLEDHGLPPIILISGWFSLISGWTDVTKVISEYTTIFYLETREKVTSILPNKKIDMSVPRMAEDFKQVISKLPFKFESSIVLGSSMGGTILMEYLAHSNLSPQVTILIGPNAHFKHPPIATDLFLLLPLVFVRVMKWIVRTYLKIFKLDTKKEPEQAEKYFNVLDIADPWKVRQSARYCLKYKSWDILDKIDAKLILVGASADKMHASEHTKKIAKSIKNTEYVDFPTNKAAHSVEMGEYVIKIAQELTLPKKEVISKDESNSRSI